MNKFKHAIFLFIFSICSYAFAFDPAGRPIRPASGGSQIACPSRDFPEFIKAFSENTEVQRAFTKYPLWKQSLDLNAEPEPKPVGRKLRRDQISFPVISSNQERAKKMLEIQVLSVTPTQGEIVLFKPDTDYRVLYFFNKSHHCWRLTRIEDWSL